MADNAQPLPDPTAVTPTPEDTVDWIVRQRQAAVNSAMNAADADPEQAARADELARATGSPPALVYGNLDQFEQQQKAALTAEILKRNQFLREYVNAHPLAAAISNDDWGRLDSLSAKLQKFHGGNPFYLPETLGQTILEAGVKSAIASGGGLTGQEPMGQWLIDAINRGKNQPHLMDPINRIIGGTLQGLVVDLPSAIFGGLTGAAREAMHQTLGTERVAPEEVPSIVNSVLPGLIGAEGVHIPHEEEARLAQEGLAKYITEGIQAARPFLQEGQVPPVGLHPLWDQIHIEQSKLDLQNLDEIFKESQQSPTRDRSPDLFADFIGQHTGDARIGISAEAIRKLYGDRIPEPEDGKLGWVPDLENQLELAEATGGDVEVPLKDWLAKADPEVMRELHDDLRVRPGGLTLNEASEIHPAEAQPVREEGRTTEPEIAPLDALRQVTKLEGPASPAESTFARPARAKGIIPEKTILSSVETPQATYESAKFTVLDALKTIDKDHLTGLPRALIEFLGDRLERLAGDTEIHVISREDMRDLNEKSGIPLGTPGFYVSDPHTIVLSEDVANGAYGHALASRILVHEAAHAATLRAIEKFPKIKTAIRLMMDEAEGLLSKEDRAFHDYAFKNEHEFIAEAFSNPHFQEVLAQTRISNELAGALKLHAKSSVWDAVRGVLKDLIQRILGKEVPDSILDGVLRIGDVIERVQDAVKEGEKGKVAPAEPIEPGRAEDREIFEKASAIGLTKKQYEKYMALIEQRRVEDAKFHQEQALKAERERQTEEWKENYPRIRKEVAQEVRERPNIAAERFLREGELYGEKVRKVKLDEAALTPEQRKALPPEFIGKGGINPEDIAGRFGYPSGNAMIEQLAKDHAERELEGLTPAAHLQKIINVETERRMKQEFGDPEQSALEAAKDHLFSETQFDLLHDETLLRATQAKAEFPFTKNDLKSWAKRQVNGQTLGTLASDKFLATAGRAGQSAENALLEENPKDAFKAKQQQYLNILVANEARKLEKERAQFTKLAQRSAKRELPGVPADYTNWIHDILIRTGNLVRRSVQDLQREIQAQAHTTLETFVASKNYDPTLWGEDALSAPAGVQMPVADFLFDPAYRKAIEDMTPEEFRAVHNSLKTLIKNGRDEQKVLVRGTKEDLAQVIDQMSQQLTHAIGKPSELNTQSRSISNTLGAWVLNMETLMNRADLDNTHGIFTQAIIRPIVEGVNYLAALEKQYGKEFRDLGDFGDLRKGVDNPIFTDPATGESMRFTRENTLAALQNAGNRQNLRKLALGYGIKDPNKVLEWLFTVTTKEDWDRAQKLGDLFEKIFEQSARMYRELSGVAPERIELEPIKTPFGTYKGWYHPLIADPLRAGDVGRKMESVMDGSGYYAPSPAAGYTKKRTGATYPLLLNFDPIPFKIKTMLNDIAMRPAVTEVAKIFRQQKFRTQFARYMGQEYMQALEPWLRDVAGQRRYMTSAQQVGTRVANYIRENIISNLIGLNPGTVMKHAPTAAIMSMREVGMRSFAREFVNLLGKDPATGESNWHFAMHGGRVGDVDWAGSEELQRRFRNWKETLTGTQQDLFRRYSMQHKFFTLRDVIQTIGAAPVAFSDLLSAVPTWLAKYHDLRDEGSSHGDAVFEADRAVRRAHGSSAISNRPEAMRGGALSQYLVPFYNFFNTVLNRQYELAWKSKLFLERRSEQQALASKGIQSIEDGTVTMRPGQYWDADRLQLEYKAGASKIPHIMGGLFAYILAPAIIEQAVSPIYTKKDSWSMIALKALAYDLASSWPILRDVVNAAMGGHDPSVGVYSTGIEDLNNMLSDIKRGKVSMDPSHAGRTIRHFNDLFGLATGLTNGEIGKLSEYLTNVNKGVEHPRGAGDIYRGIRHGTQREFNR